MWNFKQMTSYDTNSAETLMMLTPSKIRKGITENVFPSVKHTPNSSRECCG